jgi:hypothetical protein
MRRFAAFAVAGALALAVAPAVASAGSAPPLRHVAYRPFVHAGVVFVAPPIPAPRVEVVAGYPGGYGHVWVPGYWAWGGRPHGYHWVHGGWHRPPRHGSHWVPPRWSPGHGGHRWVDGHWGHRGPGWSHGGHRGGEHRRFDGNRSRGWQGRGGHWGNR